MDHETTDLQSRSSQSLAWTRSSNSSLRRLSFSMSGHVHPQLGEDSKNMESNINCYVPMAFSGSRDRTSGIRFSMDNVAGTGVVSMTEDALLQSYGFWSRDPEMLNPFSPVTPLPSDILSPLPQYAILQTEGEKQDDENSLLPRLEYISCVIHLAIFGILGVLTRYLLYKLFGPGVVGVTSDRSILYLDLPSNMVGSFLLGWFDVVFKGDISHFSDQLAVRITIGYLGSLTTCSGRNQKMLDLSVKGHWIFTVLGYLIAEGFRWLVRRIKKDSLNDTGCFKSKSRVDSCKNQLVVIIALMLMQGSLWVMSVILEKKEFKNGSSGAQLWLACLVGPLGVWIRWWLARLNGRGLGKQGWFKWIPFGTLAANVSVACVMAALTTIKKAVNTRDCDAVVNGIQLGLLGCLSTVSTFIAEFNALRLSNHTWRAYIYASITFGISFALGTLLYSMPIWTKDMIRALEVTHSACYTSMSP
ncbi:hypothetical protein Ancab_033132 [Ancistrocladus abbreviatus]